VAEAVEATYPKLIRCLGRIEALRGG
jgi:hypothetical protein